MPNFKYQGIEGYAVVFADPADIKHLVTAKSTQSTVRKKDGYFTNRLEVTDRKPTVWQKAGCADKCAVAVETLSVNVSLSGSPENEADLIKRWEETKTIVDLAISNGGLRGFKFNHTAELPVVPAPTVGS